MKKMLSVFCTIVILICLLTSCGTVLPGKRIVLPEAGDISQVTIVSNMSSTTTEDRDNIAELLQRLGAARGTGCVSIQDSLETDGVVQVEFAFRRGGVSTVFLYQEGRKLLVEQPYQGIYETDEVLENLLGLVR